ncbi:MAG: molybdate ABC transporter substrate-binding protein [Nitrososphaerota archaeon]
MNKQTLLILAAGIVIGILIGTISAASSNLYFNKPQQEKVIVVFAGAAAAPVYREAATMFESKYGVKVELRLGGSGSLLSAMEIAKTGDVYIPGSPEYIQKAIKLGIVEPDYVKKMAYLVPAIIVQKGNPKNISSLEDLAKPGISVGIADPESVCVGLYAKELLEKNGLWEEVKKNIVVYAQSCEATASLIPTRSVDAIIGWHVFKAWYPDKADIVWIEPSKIPKIGYIAGGVSTFSKEKELAEKFLEFLQSEEMADIWGKYGYYSSVQEAMIHAPNAEIEDIEAD